MVKHCVELEVRFCSEHRTAHSAGCNITTGYLTLTSEYKTARLFTDGTGLRNMVKHRVDLEVRIWSEFHSIK